MTENLLTVDEIMEDAEGRLIAVLEADGGGTVTIPVSLLPEGVRVNDVVTLRIQIDQQESEARRRRVADLQDELFDRK